MSISLVMEEFSLSYDEAKKIIKEFGFEPIEDVAAADPEEMKEAV